MSSLVERLRGIVAAVPATRPAERPRYADEDDPGVDRTPLDATADALGGAWLDEGRVLVVDRSYKPGHRHGRLSLIDHLLPEDQAWTTLLLGTRTSDESRPRGRVLFIDLETTGLAGGAGTYAFLVGCAWFEDCTFRVRQYFMASPAAERAMLDLLAEVAGECRLIVSFNGKTFDLPLIETRYLFHRRETPFASTPHLDMLHPARRLWREGEDGSLQGGCRLGTLEQALCGHQREGDVPGFEIPGRYFHYIRSGDAHPLAPVLEHNRLDLLSLAFLTSRAAHLVLEGPPLVRSAREAVGLGRLYERAGLPDRARQCYARAAGLDGQSPLGGDETTLAEALHGYAVLCRRARRFADAAGSWRRLLELRDCPDSLLRDAAEALAVHYEHRIRDPRTARSYAVTSAPLQSTAARRQALQHRLARLDQKLVAQSLSLF